MSPLHPTILPGATIGVLGSGQLGRMFALAARELGYRIFIYSPDNDTPAGQIGDQEFVHAYTELDKIREFAQQVQVVTFEFENVHSDSTSAAAEFAPVRPDGRVLHTTQNRLREKTFLEGNGFPVTPFRRINSLADLQAAVRDLGLPAVPRLCHQSQVRWLSSVENLPAIDQRQVQLEQVSQPARVSPPNHIVGDVMPSDTHPIGHALDRHLRTRQPEEGKSRPVAFCLSLHDPRGIGPRRQRSFKREGFAADRQFFESLPHQPPGLQGDCLGLESREPLGDLVRINEIPDAPPISQQPRS